MTSPSTRPTYTIRKTLNHWENSYKYEIHEAEKKKQLYSVFFNEKDDMAIFSSVTRNLMALTADYYLRLEDVVGYDTAEGIEKYNLHIKTEFGKVLLSDNLKNIRERSMKLTARETALIVKTFVCVLNDLLALLKNKFLPVYQYLKVVWKEDLFNAMYINDNFEVKVSLLPEMSQLSSIDWKALMIPFEGEVGLIFEEIVANFIKVLSPYLPMKKDKHELMSILPNLTNNNNKKFWDEIFQLPEDLMKPVFLLADVNRNTYEEKIEEAYNLVLEDEFNQFITPNFIAKYNFEEKYSKNLLKLKTEEEFYKFLHNVGLDDVVALYYSREMTTTPAQKLDIEKIETINVQKVDISVIILYDLAHKPFNSLKRLSLQACGITHDSIGVILTWDSASNLESLDFSGNPTYYNLVGSKGCEKIAQSEKMKNLKELNLASCRIDDLAVINLATSEHLKNLENLDLGFNSSIGIEGLKAINESTTLTKLNTLSLLCNKIGNEGLTELLKPSDYPKKYKSMNLCDCALTIEGIEILGRADCLENLEAVYLDSNDFSVLAGWMSFKALPNLTKLSMQACFLNDAQFEAIMSLFIPEKLAFLDVSYNSQLTLNLDDMAKLKNLKELLIESTLADERLFEKLVEDGTPYRLEKLSLQKGPLTSRLFEIVGKSQLFPNINTLSLDRVSSLQTALVFAYFLSTENSNNLEMLTLFGGSIDLYIFKYCVHNTLYLNNLKELRLIGIFTKSNQMVVELVKSGKTKNLVVFEVISCSITNDTFITMTRHEGLSNLRRLNVSGNLINYQTTVKFLESKLLPKLEYFDIGGNIKDKNQLTKLRKRQEKVREKLILVIG